MNSKHGKKGLKKVENLLLDVIFSGFIILLLLFFVKQAGVSKAALSSEKDVKGADALLEVKEDAKQKIAWENDKLTKKGEHADKDQNKADKRDQSNDEAKAKDQKKLININQADEKELKELSGIGDELARRIVEYRKKHGEFKKTSDLKRVSGIGEKKFDKIKNSICVK